jgi:hypothetical protein
MCKRFRIQQNENTAKINEDKIEKKELALNDDDGDDMIVNKMTQREYK